MVNKNDVICRCRVLWDMVQHQRRRRLDTQKRLRVSQRTGYKAPFFLPLLRSFTNRICPLGVVRIGVGFSHCLEISKNNVALAWFVLRALERYLFASSSRGKSKSEKAIAWSFELEELSMMDRRWCFWERKVCEQTERFPGIITERPHFLIGTSAIISIAGFYYP